MDTVNAALIHNPAGPRRMPSSLVKKSSKSDQACWSHILPVISQETRLKPELLEKCAMALKSTSFASASTVESEKDTSTSVPRVLTS